MLLRCYECRKRRNLACNVWLFYWVRKTLYDSIKLPGATPSVPARLKSILPYSGRGKPRSGGDQSSLLGLAGATFGGSGLSGGGGLARSGGGSVAILLGLSCNSLLLALLVLCATSLGLSLKISLTEGLSLGLVDLLDQHILVLELVTLGGEVELVVHVAVNLLLLSVSLKKATEDAKTAHVENLLGHTGVSGTSPLTAALMATLALGLSPSLAARAGVGGDDLSHDQAVLHKLPNVLA